MVPIGHIDVLPVLFENVILPSAVQAELTDPDAPASVRNWIANPLAWLEIYETPARRFDHGSVEGLDEGEAAAIALAASLRADLLLMDDRKGVIVARGKGLRVTGHPGGSRSGGATRSG